MNWREYAQVTIVVAGVAMLLATPLYTSAAPPSKTIDFNRDIRPILSDNCYFCHGPDKNKRKADLRLDTKEGLFSEIDKVFPVVPGKPNQSNLYARITSSDPDEVMPPAKGNKHLSPQQIATIKQWIEQGAAWKGHWAYQPVARPATAEPANAIDTLIGAELKSHGLRANSRADKVTLIRRAYFDLIGLPPAQAEVDAFVNDSRPNAWERVIDQLLANPHYGERMAMAWLDQVRFADTIGYHSDNPRDITPYRDWVINAFNRNEHFDQFTIEQLAGDLLPNMTQEQKIASGYNRLLQTTEEGGAQPKEYAAKYLSDRVRNLSTVWLASTMGCCECHNHKFDPFSMRDFYSMEAFFADVKEAPVGRREQGMAVLTPEQAVTLNGIEEKIAATETKLKSPLAETATQLAAAQADWEKHFTAHAQTQSAWAVVAPASLKASDGGVKLAQKPDGAIIATGKNPAKLTYTITATVPAHGITGIQLEALADATLPSGGPGRSPNGNFVLTEFKVAHAKSADKEALKSPTPVALKSTNADHSQADFDIVKTIDGNESTGWAVLPEVGKSHWAIFLPAAPIGDAGSTTLVITISHQSNFGQHALGRFRLSVTTAANPTAVSPLPSKVLAALQVPEDHRTTKQTTAITDYYRSIAPLLDPLRTELRKLGKQREALLASTRKSLITVAEEPKPVRILSRGNWLDDSGEIVEPAVPAFLGKLDTAGKRATRLDLARWLVTRNNPLVARAFINRLWMRFFGRGLSAKLDDLGAQGEWPTHPELLDWLASEFIANGFDIKQIIKLILLSQTYQESSVPTTETAAHDPANLWLARQGRFRFDAEVVRDNALSISDLLVTTIGGESVKPYQPEGYWSFLNFPTRTWVADKGNALYRRGIYTWWQRTFLQPSLLAFDAPTREEAVCERTRSNVPQQALTLLNDPSYVEASRVFAEHILQHGGSTTADRLTWGYRKALNRPPRPEETELLTQLLEKHQHQYTSDPQAALALLNGSGEAPATKDVTPTELAAWTSVARVILNLHETITRN